MGIAYYNLHNDNEALKQYTAILQQFPNSPEAEAALENARIIYIDQGKTSEYVKFARSMGKQISVNQEDELAYQEAEVQFNNGNFPARCQKFEEYLSRFPEGQVFTGSDCIIKARYILTRRIGQKLLRDMSYWQTGRLISLVKKSMLLAARLNFFDLKNYEKAEKYFIKLKEFSSSQENKLEAMRGLLRSQYQLEKWTEAVDNAHDLLNQKGIGTDDKVLANMAIAKSYQTGNKCEQAITYYRQVASLNKSSYGAEVTVCHSTMFFYTGPAERCGKSGF